MLVNIIKQASYLDIYGAADQNLFGWPELMARLRVLAGRMPRKKM